jgi:hypothetical protein
LTSKGSQLPCFGQLAFLFNCGHPDEKKQKLMVFSALTLVATITALTSFSLAWFENNLPIDNTLSLSSGESVASLEGYLYQQNPDNQQTQDLLGFYKNQGSYLNVTRKPDQTDVGAFNITFSDSVFLDLNLLDTYLNEFALNELAFPTYYVELRIIKEKLRRLHQDDHGIYRTSHGHEQ